MRRKSRHFAARFAAAALEFTNTLIKTRRRRARERVAIKHNS